MTTPLFITDDSQITVEGVYIKETDPPASVAGVSLNGVAVFGTTLKGPIGKAVEITSESRFLQVFGGGWLNGAIVSNVWKSLVNKSFSKLVIARVAAAAAVKASFTTETAAAGGGTAIMRIDASSVGAWGNYLKFKVAAATNAVATSFNLIIKDTITGNTVTYENLSCNGTDDNLAVTVGTDDGRLVDLVKLANGRPVNNAAGVDGADSDGFTFLGQTVAAFTSVAGADGTVAETDYYGTNKGLDLVKAYVGTGAPAIVFCAEFYHANLLTQMRTAALASSDRLFLCGPATDATTVSTAATEAQTAVSDRIVYTFNHPYTFEPVNGTEILTRPESWMATVLANTDVDIHPGEEDTKRYLAGISRLSQASLSRADYTALKAAGICALEVDLGNPVFVSGEVTSRVAGKTQITRRRMADFLQLSGANALRYHVKKKNTVERRRAINATLKGWLQTLQGNSRIVESFVIDGEILNNETDRANGIERILMRVKLIGHMLFIVLQTEIGTGVTITTD